MEDKAILKFGGMAAIALGGAYATTGLAFLAQPAGLRVIDPETFWTTLVQDSTAHLLIHWASVATGLLGLAVVPAVAKLVYTKHKGLILWTSIMACLGFAMNARGHLMEVAFDRKIIPIYLDAEPATRQAVHVVAGLALDVPDGFLSFGAVGFWILVVCTLTAQNRILSKPLSYLGIATGLSFFLGVIGFTVVNMFLITLAAGLGTVILAPIWCIWLGVSLY